MRDLAALLALVVLAGCAVAPASIDDWLVARPATAEAHDAAASDAEPAAAALPRTLSAGERLTSSAERPASPRSRPAIGPAYVPDHCVERDLLTPHRAPEDYARTVLDRSYMLDPGYVPPDLVPAAGAGFPGAQGALLVRAIMLDDLAALRADSVAAGLAIELESAYRSAAEQAATFNHWVGLLGYEAGLARTARPGHSEHQLGTGVDFTSPGWSGVFGDWALTPEGAWLAEHGWRYGFVMSYPAGS